MHFNKTNWGRMALFSFMLLFVFLNCNYSLAQVKELEALRASIYRFTQYDNGKTDSIPKNKQNTERLKAELDKAWMSLVLHKNSKNLDSLKQGAVNNQTSYIIGNHNYFFSEFRRDFSVRSTENNVYYSIVFYGIYDYGLPNFVSVFIQPFTVDNKELVIYYLKLNGSGTYFIKDIAYNKIIFKSDALNSGVPVSAFHKIDNNHWLLVEVMENHGQRAMILENTSSTWKPTKAFKGMAFENPIGDYKKKKDIGTRIFLRFAENKNIVSIYGSGFLKKYEIQFDEVNKTISYKKYHKDENEAPVIKAVWKNNCFVIDDYYLGEDLNDEPMPFPG